MKLSNDLVSQFAKITNDRMKNNQETIMYGTVVKNGNKLCVKIDGSDLIIDDTNCLTPMISTSAVSENDRVILVIKNHTVMVIGNVSSPSAKDADIKSINKKLEGLGVLDLEELKNEINDVSKDVENLYLNKIDKTYADSQYATKTDVSGVYKEIPVILRIESSIGNTITNDSESLVINASVIYGSKIITDITSLHQYFGYSSYLRWKYKATDSNGYTNIESTDSRLVNNGFTLTPNIDDIENKLTYICELIT